MMEQTPAIITMIAKIIAVRNADGEISVSGTALLTVVFFLLVVVAALWVWSSLSALKVARIGVVLTLTLIASVAAVILALSAAQAAGEKAGLIAGEINLFIAWALGFAGCFHIMKASKEEL